MSQRNVGLVVEGFDAYNRGDLDGLLDTYAPYVEAFPDESFPESAPMRGRDAVRPWLEALATAWVEGTVRFFHSGAFRSRRWPRGASRRMGRSRCRQRGRSDSEPLVGLFDPRRPDISNRLVLRPPEGPQSRGPGGVGDVAGEPGPRALGYQVRRHCRPHGLDGIPYN